MLWLRCRAQPKTFFVTRTRQQRQDIPVVQIENQARGREQVEEGAERYEEN